MKESHKNAVLVAAAGGYLLGRTKKAKLALVLGSLVAGRRLGLDPQELLRKGVRKVAGTPQFEELSEQIRGELTTAARSAVRAVADRRIDTFTDSLRQRTARLNGDSSGAADAEAEQAREKDVQEEGTGEREPQDGRSARRTSGAARRPASSARREKRTLSSEGGKSAERAGHTGGRHG